ncbi:hypothetical protein SARC_11864 [Sphaeroforma arctica JP610]|uniref:histidinol-phosphatase n=1 Tax=Sphaeroforma arctica JP610 TaxID=667725 RepID=A0A0L0FGP4_9EUKA|nr:hypothetical protein SARC_11864 [Sphaeroforma arctica JP610]KNC75616.1 hypothetical protein SARC_11864 [Sphaeroforma arctica JP610]|eukprot:XP_014149518.1 hypothetical protein SARC_11864 [Sphaeroforma arctica JP610]
MVSLSHASLSCIARPVRLSYLEGLIMAPLVSRVSYTSLLRDMQGFTCLGLSEHMPRCKPQFMYPEEIECGLTPQSLEDIFTQYVRTARSMQRSAADRITLLVGLESEYTCAADLETVARLRKTHSLDFIVGSVHHVEGIPIDFDDDCFQRAEALLGSTEAVFLRYFDHQYEVIQHLKPEVLGHFDVVRLLRPGTPITEDVWAAIRRNVKLAIETGCLFEVNASGLRKGLAGAYPLPDIMHYIVQQGAKFTISDDSHSAEQVATHYAQLKEYLIKHQVTQLYTLVRDQEADPVRVTEFQDWQAHPSWEL